MKADRTIVAIAGVLIGAMEDGWIAGVLFAALLIVSAAGDSVEKEKAK
jgi:hypothetical protein